MTQLDEAISRMLPRGVTYAAGPHDDLADPLYPQESEPVANAIPRRYAEFRAGRSAARRALVKLGVAPQAIPRAEDRQPIWPKGIVGAISHSKSHAAAIVGQGSVFHGLGIDIEPDTPLDDKLIDRILLPEEQYRPETAKLRFSIKEAGYKALYPEFGRFLGFEEARTTIWGETEGTLSIDILPDDWLGPRRIEGLWCRAAGHCIAVVIRAKDSG